MVKKLLHILLQRRAHKIVRRIDPWLKEDRHIIDIGCATGHNTLELAKDTSRTVNGLDVVDMRWGSSPLVLYDGVKMPFASNSFDAACIIYILQYVDDPAAFLREAQRITAGNIVLMQTLSRGRIGRSMLPVYEYFAGVLPLRVCKLLGIVNISLDPLQPRQQFSQDEMKTLLERSGCKIMHQQRMGSFLIYNQLYVIRKYEA